MDSMDNLRGRLEVLEQQTEQLQHHARTVVRPRKAGVCS
jgi:hypothetical protein